MNEKNEKVTHDPKSLPTTPRLASLGFFTDLSYELLIRHPQAPAASYGAPTGLGGHTPPSELLFTGTYSCTRPSAAIEAIRMTGTRP